MSTSSITPTDRNRFCVYACEPLTESPGRLATTGEILPRSSASPFVVIAGNRMGQRRSRRRRTSAGSKWIAVCFVITMACAQDSRLHPIEPDSSLSRIVPGMTEMQVIEILGEPTITRSHATAKSLIPYYFGSDTNRVEWTYPGVGKVIFSMNRYTGRLSVVEVGPD